MRYHRYDTAQLTFCPLLVGYLTVKGYRVLTLDTIWGRVGFMVEFILTRPSYDKDE